MPNSSSRNSLVETLIADFPQFAFAPDKVCRWSPETQTIFFTDDDAGLLHELGHALLDHNDFAQDIELLHIERDAWNKACEIAAKYDVAIDDEQIEDALDTYREWLHARSKCPNCQQTGVQSVKTGVYSCVNCLAKWTTNDARICGLRRRLI